MGQLDDWREFYDTEEDYDLIIDAITSDSYNQTTVVDYTTEILVGNLKEMCGDNPAKTKGNTSQKKPIEFETPANWRHKPNYRDNFKH